MATRTPIKSEVAARQPVVQVVSRYIGHDDVEYATEQEAMLSWEEHALGRVIYDTVDTIMSAGAAYETAKLLSRRCNAQGRSKWEDLLAALGIEVNYYPAG